LRFRIVAKAEQNSIYIFVYSSKYNFVFVHVPKTGGTSIRHLLEPLCAKNITSHHTALDIRSIIGSSKYDKALSFTVIRNPWDRLVSLYHHNTRNKDPDFVPIPFDEFINICYHKHGIPHTLNSLFYLTDNTECKSSIRACYRPNDDFRGRIIVNRILRFENLNEDWKEIAKTINSGIKPTKRIFFLYATRQIFTKHVKNPKIPMSLPNLNVTKNRKHYREYYTDETIGMVAEMYKHEIEIFKYAF